MGALTLQLVSMATVVAVFGAVLWSKSGGELIRLFKEQPGLFWKLAFANGIQAGLGTSLSLVGIALTAAINAGFLVKLATVSTILFAWLILKERLTLLKLATMAVMLAGAYLLTTKGQALLPRTGDALILGACVCWSLGNVLVRKFLSTNAVGPDAVTLQKPLAGLPVLVVLIGLSAAAPSLAGGLLGCCGFELNELPYALASGVCLALAWIFLYRTLKVATASYMTLMSMATPVLVSILALVFLGERMEGVQMVGAGMILAAGALVYLSDVAG